MKNEFKKPDSKTLKETLTPLQYEVTQNEATEPPFLNDFFDHKEEGIYVDVVSGEVLFSSLDKFDSGCGWPSFTKPVESQSVHYKDDNSRGRQRIEVRSKAADSHLGHVFNDGPWPLETRYCINSAALRFVPKNKMKDEGYEDYLKLFKPKVLDSIVLAAGCFWGVQHLFKNLTGVTQTKVGYCGDEAKTAFYEYVKTSKTRHAEAVWVEYDLSMISTENVLRYFFRLHDPTTFERQGNDVGPQYRSAIFYQTPAQKEAAEKVIRELNASGKFLKPIVTEVVEKTPFYDAEDLHQDYLVKNPNGYFCHVLREG